LNKRPDCSSGPTEKEDTTPPILKIVGSQRDSPTSRRRNRLTDPGDVVIVLER